MRSNSPWQDRDCPDAAVRAGDGLRRRRRAAESSNASSSRGRSDLPGVRGPGRGIDVEDDLARSLVVAVEKDVYEEVVDCFGVHFELLVAIIRRSALGAEFEAIDRALAGKSLAPITHPSALRAQHVRLPGSSGQERVAAKLVMSVHVLVAECDREDPLFQEFLAAVLDTIRITMVGEALREPRDVATMTLELREQQNPTVGADVAAIESGDYFTSPGGLEKETLTRIICFHESPFVCVRKPLRHNDCWHIKRAFM